MKIAVLSDTHSQALPKKLVEALKKVDLIIHAGDFCSLKDFDPLKKIKEIKAVHGNMDDLELRKILPKRLIFEVENVRIGLFHGYGPPQKLPDEVSAEFKNDKVQVIVFGHSHQPLNEKRGGILFFNPGSPSDKIYAPYCSYGLMDIQQGQIKAQIIKLD